MPARRQQFARRWAWSAIRHRLFVGIGAERLDPARGRRSPPRTANRRARRRRRRKRPAAGLRHERREVADAAADDDVDALHRDAAAQRGIAVDHQQAAVPRRAGALAMRSLSRARGPTSCSRRRRADVAVHGDVAPACSCRPRSSRRARDVDVDRRVDADGDAVRAVRVQRRARARALRGNSLMQELVELAHAVASKDRRSRASADGARPRVDTRSP